LVGLLQEWLHPAPSMRSLHGWNSSKINNHVLISKHCASISHHYICIIAIQHFLNGMFHAFRTHKLTFFKFTIFPVLAAATTKSVWRTKSWNFKHLHIEQPLQHLHWYEYQSRLNTKSLRHFSQNFNAFRHQFLKTINSRTVCFWKIPTKGIKHQ
jgi:hypothetical protein